MEEWKQIEDYENYSVSNFGNVKNNKTNKIMKPTIDKDGYYKVNLYGNNIRKYFFIHRLVGLHFLEKIEGKDTIDHINRCKTNNNINNLRFATRNEQAKNRDKLKNCSSIYKGVYFDKSKNKWRCQIMINKQTIHLGCFENEIDAGKRYNEYIIENKLEGYVLNDIPN